MKKNLKLFCWATGILLIQSYQIACSQVLNDNVYKFSKVVSIINTFYVDTVNQTKLVEDAIIGMLEHLDPHSIYIPKDEVDEMNEPLQGNFEGVGIQFNIMNDTILVVSTIAGGPSEKVGIVAGDRILRINDTVVAGIGIKNKDVMAKLRGNKGTIVKVAISRRGAKEPLDFNITRDKIPIYSLDASYIINTDIGYIKLNRFSATTLKEFNDALAKLKKMGAKNLILDLQGNGGGYLNSAIDLADHFLNDTKLIVYTEGISSPKNENRATAKGDFQEGKLIILVDEGSASASEIVSGAVQDWDRGLIIGRRTFGKGLVQRPFNLPDGSMMRLTIARYFTPTGRLIQKSYESGVDAYSKDIVNRYNNGELVHADSIHFPDSLKFKTLVNKRTVYGGGGIMPDFFVPIDTTRVTDYYRELIRKGILNRFQLTYLDNNRKELAKQYPDFAVFKAQFAITDQMLNDLVAMAEKDKIVKREDQFNTSKDDIKLLMKAMLARDFWSSSEFYEIMNQNNPTYQKAVEVMGNTSVFNKKLSGTK